MYSRFTPGPDGVYRRSSVSGSSAPPLQSPQEAQSLTPLQEAPPPAGLKQRLSALLPGDLDLGDVLVLLIALLLMVDEEADLQTILLTLGAFFLL